MPLDAECLAQLKLRQQPFDEVPSEDFLYTDPLLESLVETASHALRAPGAIVILAGAEGSGRSVQLMRLLGALDDGFELIAFRGRANIAFDAIDVTIRNHLRSGGFDDPRRTLSELLGERARAGVALVLAIDDAHLVGAESVRRLLRIRAEILEAGGQGLRLVVVGDPSFSRGSLPLPDPIDDAQVVRLNLRPFNLEQAGAYLRHRLRVAGVEDPDTFMTSGDIAVLQTNSKGLPRALDRNANAWLTRRCRSTGAAKPSVTAKLSGSRGSAAMPTQSRFDRPPDDDLRARVDAGNEVPEGILELESEAESRPSARVQPTDPELSRYLVGEDVRRDNEDFEQILRHVRQHARSQTPAQQAELASAPGSASATLPYWNRPWFIPVIVLVVLVAILIPVGFQLMEQAPRQVPSRDAEVQPASPEVKAPPGDAVDSGQTRALPAQTPAAPVAVSEAPEPSPPVPVEPVEPEADSEPVAPEEPPSAVTAQPATEGADMAEDLDWLMRQDPERFTVQLVAAADLATSKAFMAPHDLGGIHYIKTRTYVIALFGSFPNRAAASKALPDLPRAVRDNGPWIRTIGSIRGSLP
ncbi:AAA family ATPase [Thiocystis violacea]|uniref:AAA family ATPase n=1 Tax=Thiocystis violacea TaxID=13725 RepID=UPI001904BB2A|nr:AAA family ATPase [Thiocystis violacea]MBK1721337.1 sporulation protein [Thiocystis violacea]